MGFFPNLDKEGPGVEKDTPRKRGFARLWELLDRDLWAIFRAGFLALAGAVPFLVGTAFCLNSHVLLFAPMAGLAGGALAGPQLCALSDTILRALRDEPGFWWHKYKRAWRRSAKAALLPGAVGGALLETDVFLLFHAGALGLSTTAGAALVAGILLVIGLSLYVWPLLALMELSFPQLVKNAGLLFLGQLPRSLCALAIMGGYWGAVLWTFQLAVTLLPLTNFWLPALPALFLIYPGMERAFQIEAKLADIQPQDEGEDC